MQSFFIAILTTKIHRSRPVRRFSADFPLEIYIEFAYKIMPTREQEDAMTAPLPKWVSTDHFVIQAEAEGYPTKDQVRLMMQSASC